MAHVEHVPTSVCCPRHLGSMCNVTGGQNQPSIISLNTLSCPFLCGAALGNWLWSNCRWWLFNFFLLLFYLMTSNVHHYPLSFLLFNSNPHSLCFLFHSFSIYRSFFLLNLVMQLIFLVCFFSVIILLIFYFILISFIKVFFSI